MIISIPKPLRERLGEEASESLVAMLNDYGREIEGSIIEKAEKRFEVVLIREIGALREEMHAADAGLREEMQALGAGLREEMQSMEIRLGKEIAAVSSEVHRASAANTRWMFVFWVGQIGAIMGFMFAFFH